MAKRLLNNPKVTILWNTVAVECQGDGDLLNNLRIKNVLTGEEKDLPVNGLFYAIGHEPATALVRGQLQTEVRKTATESLERDDTQPEIKLQAQDERCQWPRAALDRLGAGPLTHQCMTSVNARQPLCPKLPCRL